MLLQEIYILDLIGTFAFAIYGSYFALKEDFDIFGISVCAFLMAVGGGTLREVILGNIPFYFFDMNYIIIICLAIIFTIFIYKKFHRIKTFALILDSVGLVTFAFIGASKANQLGLGLLAIVCLAALSAVGGGIMKDLIINKIPEIMYRDFYTSVAVLLGFTYGIFQNYMNSLIWVNLLIISCLALRLIAVFFKINLWKPNIK